MSPLGQKLTWLERPLVALSRHRRLLNVRVAPTAALGGIDIYFRFAFKSCLILQIMACPRSAMSGP
jgi:hypothetical protein